MQEFPDSDRETIETYSPLSQTSVELLKSHAQHIQGKCIQRKKHSWAHKQYTQRNNTSHEIESKNHFY